MRKQILLFGAMLMMFLACEKDKVTNDLTIHVTYGTYNTQRTNLKGATVYLFKGIGSEIENYEYSGNGVIKNTKTGDTPTVLKIAKTDYFGEAIFKDLDGVVYAFVADISDLSKDYPEIESFKKRHTYLTSIGSNTSEVYFDTWPYSIIHFNN